MQTITDCVNLAFSDYELPTHVDESKLSGMFTCAGVELSLSFGAFDDAGGLVGFAVNGTGEYMGSFTAFDVMSAVLPQCRGKGVFHGMLELMYPRLREAGVGVYALEVLKTNVRAVRLYESLGLKKRRSFSVLMKDGDTSLCAGESIRTASLAGIDITKITLPGERVPSYENTPLRLINTADVYSLIFTGEISSPAAFVLCRSDTGYIAHADCAAGAEDKLQEVLGYALSLKKRIMIKNIDENDGVLIKICKSFGCREYARQYEMAAEL